MRWKMKLLKLRTKINSLPALLARQPKKMFLPRIFFTLGIFLFSFSQSAFAASPDLVISEIAWMGTQESASSEWIELWNATDQPINVEGWLLEAQDGSPRIELKGQIEARGLFLLERTDEETLPNVSADAIYTGALSNSGELLTIKNPQGQEIFRIDATAGWPAGDNKTKETMHYSQGAWVTASPSPRAHTNQDPPEITKGVEGMQNEESTQEEEIGGQNEMLPPKEFNVQEEPQVIKTVNVENLSHLYISEFMPNPSGPDAEQEWIELYNDSEHNISLNGLVLDDKEGGSHPYSIPPDTTIEAKGFLVFPRAQTGIALNTTNDQVRILYQTGEILAQVAYDNAPQDGVASFNPETKTLSWSLHKTPGKTNKTTTNILTTQVGKETTLMHQNQNLTIAELPDLNAKTLGASAIPAQERTRTISPLWYIGIVILLAIALVTYLSKKRGFFLLILGGILLTPTFTFAAELFFVEPHIDAHHRSQIEAEFGASGVYSSIYVDTLLSIPQSKLQELVNIFDSSIYPQSVALFGPPWIPGIDNDQRITILLSTMQGNVGGYVNDIDEMPKAQAPRSNEREMIYINGNFINSPKLKAFIAHEFQHVITYNQKKLEHGVVEQRWLNELRSEYIPTYLGFDGVPGSNLQERIHFFLQNPGDSIIGWINTDYDYASVNLFGQYLADRFGANFYRYMMDSSLTGIYSVREALSRVNATESFEQVFAEWQLANYVNDKNILDGRYSYRNPMITFKVPNRALFTKGEIGDERKSLLNKNLTAFTSHVIEIQAEGEGVEFTFTAESPSSNLFALYLYQTQNGEFITGTTLLEEKSTSLNLNQKIDRLYLLIANTQTSFDQVGVNVEARIFESLTPAIYEVLPVFLNQGFGGRSLIKGDNFTKELTLKVNGKTVPFVYQNNSLIIANLPKEDYLSISVVNPDGQTGEFQLRGEAQGEIKDGSLLQVQESGEMYIIKGEYVRHLKKEVLSYYPHLEHQKLIEIPSMQLDRYQRSNLIRYVEAPEVYEILPDGKKGWIKNETEFFSRGFNWDAVYIVNGSEFESYPVVR